MDANKRDDLLKMLDLAGQDAGGVDANDVSFCPAEPPTDGHASPTALDLDDWALRRGREALSASERLQKTDLDEYAVADFFGASFEPDPKLHEACVDARRLEFLSQLVQTPDYLPRPPRQHPAERRRQ